MAWAPESTKAFTSCPFTWICLTFDIYLLLLCRKYTEVIQHDDGDDGDDDANKDDEDDAADLAVDVEHNDNDEDDGDDEDDKDDENEAADLAVDVKHNDGAEALWRGLHRQLHVVVDVLLLDLLQYKHEARNTEEDEEERRCLGPAG